MWTLQNTMSVSQMHFIDVFFAASSHLVTCVFCGFRSRFRQVASLLCPILVAVDLSERVTPWEGENESVMSPTCLKSDSASHQPKFVGKVSLPSCAYVLYAGKAFASATARKKDKHRISQRYDFMRSWNDVKLLSFQLFSNVDSTWQYL